MAAAMADLAGGEAAGAHLSLEGKSVAQIASAGDDAGDDGAFLLACNQGVDQVDLVHGHELKDFTAYLARCGAGQFLDHLQMLRRPRRRR